AAPAERRALAEADAPVIALAADETAAATALAAGARGVLSREAPAARIAAAVRATLGGLLVVDAAMAGALLRPPPEAEGLPDALTPRETEVLQLLAQGLSNRAVADRLAISEHTAKFHVNAILGKLGARGRTDAVV